MKDLEQSFVSDKKSQKRSESQRRESVSFSKARRELRGRKAWMVWTLKIVFQ